MSGYVARVILILCLLCCVCGKSYSANDEIIGWGKDTYGEASPWFYLSGVVAIAAGYHHSLALQSDGEVIGWGNDSWGQASGSSTVGQIGIAAGNSYSLSFGSSGSVEGWGEGYNGTIPIPWPAVVAIAAGTSHGLALRTDGSVVSFGYYTEVPPGLSNMVAVAAGVNHSLALRADGVVVGWDYYGATNDDRFSVISGLSNVVAIAAEGDVSLALMREGTVAAWSVLSPDLIFWPGLSNAIATSAGGGHELALRADGTVVAWGANSYGQSTVPPWLSNVVAIAAGGNHSLALRGSPPGVAVPVPITPRVMIATADRPFFQRIIVKNSATAYGASGLPAGLVLNPTNGLITGQPITNGVYSITLSATNSQGSTNWTVPLHVNLPLPFVIITNFVRATIGRAFELQPIWGNVDHIESSGLPPGVSLIPTNGFIRGMPTAVGDYTVSLLASNRFGVASNGFVLRVTELLGWGSDSSFQLRFPGSLTNVVAIAACQDHGVALKTNGAVVGWVAPGSPNGVSNVVSVAAGLEHNLALRSDGTTAAWGINSFGQTSIPNGLTNLIAVAAGYYHNLVLRSDGTVFSWGRNNFGPTNIPAGLDHVVAIAGGLDHSLALRADRTVIAWGRNNFGQTTIPASLTNVVAIAAGGNHNLALRGDGTVVSWGSNSSGQTNTPSGLSNVVAIAAGGSHSLASRADGTVVGWGGALGAGQQIPPAGLSNVVAIAAGSLHSIALCGLPPGLRAPELVGRREYFATANLPFYERIVVKNGVAAYGVTGLPAGLTFDANTGLITGQPTAVGSFTITIYATNAVGFSSWSVPITIHPLPPTIQSPPLVRAALSNWVDLDAVHDAESITISELPPGLAASPQTGRITGIPTLVGSYEVSVVASNQYGVVPGTFRISIDSIVHWGSNSNGLGNLPAGLGNVVNIASGDLHVLALRADGRVATWGANTFSQTNVPTTLSNVVGIAAGGSHSLARRSDGTVVGWGNNGFGQRTIPAGLSNVVALAAGNTHSLALRTDGLVVGWGNNGSGQTTIPAGLSNVVAIAAGNSHSLALRGNGTVTGWGDNTYGQRTVPFGLSNVVAIAAGSFHSLALRANGTLAAWGQNSFQQASVPAGLSNVIAIAAGNSNSLALRADGTAFVWGLNSAGQTNVPVGLSNVVALVAGSQHGIALVAAPAEQPVMNLYPSAGGSLTLALQGLIAAGYRIHTGTNLNGLTGWQTIWQGTLQDSRRSLVWANAGEPARFFRAEHVATASGPRLTIRAAAERELLLLHEPVSGGNHTIQATTNLTAPGGWSAIWSGVPGNGIISLRVTNSGDSQRFFRLVRP